MQPAGLHQTLRDKHKGWPGQVSGGGEGWGRTKYRAAAPSWLPDSSIVRSGGSWTSRKWATSLPTKERKLPECFSSTSQAGPEAGDGSWAKAACPSTWPGHAAPTLCLHCTLVSLPASSNQTLPVLTTRPSCPRSIHKAPPIPSSLRAVALGSNPVSVSY